MTISINRGEIFILKTATVKGDEEVTQGLFVAIKHVDLEAQMDSYLLIHPERRPPSFARWMVNNKAVAPIKTRMITTTKTHDGKPVVYDSNPVMPIIQYDGRGGHKD